MKVIHFITDEKFLNLAIELFEEIEELENRYINIIYDEDRPFQFITSDKVEIINISDIHDIITDPSVCDVIVIHNLSSLPCEQIMNIDKKIKVVWFSWGFDIYSNQYPQFQLIKLKNRIKTKTLNFRYRLRILNENRRLLFSKLFNKKEKDRKVFISAISRIDYYSGVYPIEYDLLKKNFFFRAKQIFFNYPTKKGLFSEENIYKQLKPKGDSIQISNSGAILGNHGNILNKMHNLNLNKRKIIIPLSYGGDSLYRSIVRKKFIKIFDGNCVPLTKFIQLEKYIELMESISVALYDYEQQAAVGNILYNLWNGSKVFLPESSLNYIFFKSIGVHVYSLDKELTQMEIDTQLQEKDILDNRIKILNYFSYDIIKNKTKKSFLLIENHIKCQNNEH